MCYSKQLSGRDGLKYRTGLSSCDKAVLTPHDFAYALNIDMGSGASDCCFPAVKRLVSASMVRITAKSRINGLRCNAKGVPFVHASSVSG